MSQFEIVSRRGKPIRSVEEWGVEARPAKADHWQDERCAKELAEAWISGSGPAALISLLDHDPATAGLRIDRAVAEAKTAFDRWPGGKCNHDLLEKNSPPVRSTTARKAALTEWASAQNLDVNACRFLSAFVSRTAQPFRQLIAVLAWGTHVLSWTIRNT